MRMASYRHGSHAAEFKDSKWDTVEPGPLRSVKDWPPGFNENRHCDQNDQRTEDDDSYRCRYEVEYSFQQLSEFPIQLLRRALATSPPLYVMSIAGLSSTKYSKNVTPFELVRR